MTRAPLQDLVRLTAARKASEEARMRRLAGEEAEIRAELAALDDRHRRALALPAADMVDQRRIGADILWQGWIGRSRRRLQIRLAQVLAKKGAALRDLRRAHGRCTASEDLLKSADKTVRDRQLKDQIAQEQSLVLIRTALETRR